MAPAKEKGKPLSRLQRERMSRQTAAREIARIERDAQLNGAMSVITYLEFHLLAGDDLITTFVRLRKSVFEELEEP